MNRFASAVKSLLYPKVKPNLVKAKDSNTIVLILGWGGSNPWNFKRLEAHYATRNVTTIQFTMPLFCPKLVRTSFETDIGQLLKDQVEEHQKDGKKPRFVIHSFSNNGAWCLSNLLKDNKLVMKPEKIMLDSSPWFIYERDVPFEAKVLSQLVTSVYLGRAEYNLFPLTPIAKVLFLIQLSLSKLTDKIVPFKYYFFTDYFAMHAYLRDNFPVVPTYFVCSSGDQLVPPATIVPFRKAIEATGVTTQVYEFGEDVPHVCSMFKQTDQYMALVDEFFELDNKNSVKV